MTSTIWDHSIYEKMSGVTLESVIITPSGVPSAASQNSGCHRSRFAWSESTSLTTWILGRPSSRPWPQRASNVSSRNQGCTMSFHSLQTVYLPCQRGHFSLHMTGMPESCPFYQKIVCMLSFVFIVLCSHACLNTDQTWASCSIERPKLLLKKCAPRRLPNIIRQSGLLRTLHSLYYCSNQSMSAHCISGSPWYAIGRHR